MNAEGHLTTEENAAYWHRTLSPSALLAISNHLQTCAHCREQLLRGRPANVSGNQPRFEELLDWMDLKLGPIARHELARRLENSPAAEAELADLLKFREEMNQLSERTYSPEDAAPRSGPSWILPIAAGLAIGLGFLWLTSIQEKRGGIVLHDAGKEIVVTQDGRIPVLGRFPSELTQSIKKTVASGQVTLPPELLALRRSANVLAGSPSPAQTFEAIAPVGTLVESPQPTFRWSPHEGATGYRINLLAKSSGQLLTSPVIDGKASTWIPDQLLKPTESYEWEVEALRDGEMIAKAPAPPAPEARFALLPNEKRAELAKLREKFGRSHLVMGLAYAEAGLLEPARTEFEALARENPTSELPKKILAGLTNPAP